MKKAIKLVLIPILLVLALAFLALGPLSTLKVIGQGGEKVVAEEVVEGTEPKPETTEGETIEPAVEPDVTTNGDEGATGPTAEGNPVIEPTTEGVEDTEPTANETPSTEEPTIEPTVEAEVVEEKRELGAFLIEILHLNVISDKIGNHLFTTISSFLSALCFENLVLLIISLFPRKNKSKGKFAKPQNGGVERKVPEPIEGNKDKSPIKF